LNDTNNTDKKVGTTDIHIGIGDRVDKLISIEQRQIEELTMKVAHAKRLTKATIKLEAELSLFKDEEKRLKAYLISKTYKLVLRLTEIVTASIPAISAFITLFVAIVK